MQTPLLTFALFAILSDTDPRLTPAAFVPAFIATRFRRLGGVVFHGGPLTAFTALKFMRV